MNTLKKLAALLLVCVFVFSLSACHPKDEIALTVGDVEITSALYMCALMNADSEARTKVDEAKSASSTSSTAATTDYYSEKIDKKDYTTWVKDRALEICKEYAAYEQICAEKKLELTEDELANLDSYVDYYWSYYGYAALYEPNGVGKETFKRSLKSSYLSSAYFKSIYDEGGTKAIAKDEVKKTMEENFVIADVLSGNFTSEMKDSDKATLKTKFQGFVDRLNKGESFEKIYNEYYEIKETDEQKTEETDDTPAPKDKFATVLGSKDTDYANDNYETVKAMKNGEIKLVSNDSGVTILIRGDLMGDEYWIDNLTVPVLNLLKGDEFEKEMDSYIEKLEVKQNNYAVNRFKVKKIVYPTY